MNVKSDIDDEARASDVRLRGRFNLKQISTFDPNIQFIQPFALNASPAVLSDPNLEFRDNSPAPPTIVRQTGSWFDDGFVKGQEIIVEQGSNNGNNHTFTIADIPNATTLELSGTDMVNPEGMKGGYVARGGGPVAVRHGRQRG